MLQPLNRRVSVEAVFHLGKLSTTFVYLEKHISPENVHPPNGSEQREKCNRVTDFDGAVGLDPDACNPTSR